MIKIASKLPAKLYIVSYGLIISNNNIAYMSIIKLILSISNKHYIYYS